MTAIDRAREAYNRADQRAEVLRNRWETLLLLEAKKQALRAMKQERKESKGHE